MGWLLKLATGNPITLLWIAGGIFLAGLAAGGAGAWTVQGWRLDAAKAATVVVQGKFDAFVSQAKAIGEAQNKAAAAKDAENRSRQEKSNAENAKTKSDMAGIYAAYRGLRDTRSGSNSGQLPPAASITSSAARTCFGTAELVAAMGILETGVPNITQQGDSAVTDLATARRWAQAR